MRDALKSPIFFISIFVIKIINLYMLAIIPMNRILVKKARDMADRLEFLLSDEQLLYRLLSDPSISYKLLFVVGALKIKVPFPAPSRARGAS